MHSSNTGLLGRDPPKYGVVLLTGQIRRQEMSHSSCAQRRAGIKMGSRTPMLAFHCLKAGWYQA